MAVGPVIGREISYTRAAVSALPFVGVLATVVNLVQAYQKEGSLDAQKDRTAGDKKAINAQIMRHTDVSIAYAKLGVLSGVLTLAIMIGVAVGVKMDWRFAVVACAVPALTAGCSGIYWHFTNQTKPLQKSIDLLEGMQAVCRENKRLLDNIASFF